MRQEPICSIPPVAPVRDHDDDQHLDIAGNHRGDRRAARAQRRCAKVAKDQYVIAHKVHQYAGNGSRHGQLRFAGHAQRAGIGLRHGEGKQAEQHDAHVAHARLQRVLRAADGFHIVDIVADQRTAEPGQHRNRDRAEPDGQKNGIAE